MKFEDIPNTVKATVAIGVLAVAAFTYHEQFITEAEASNNVRVMLINDIEAELRNLKRQLRITREETLIQLLKDDIQELEKKLECLKTADDEKVQFC